MVKHLRNGDLSAAGLRRRGLDILIVLSPIDGQLLTRFMAVNRAMPELVLACVGEYSREELQALVDAGFTGFMRSCTTDAALLRACRALKQDRHFLDDDLTRRFFELLRPARPNGSGFKLSARERDMVEGLVRGLSDGEIAAALGNSAYTIRQHLKSIFRKMSVVSRTQAAMKWVVLPPPPTVNSDSARAPVPPRPGSGIAKS